VQCGRTGRDALLGQWPKGRNGESNWLVKIEGKGKGFVRDVCVCLWVNFRLEFDVSQVSRPAPPPKQESITRENASTVEEGVDPSQLSTCRSEWSVDSVGQDEVQPSRMINLRNRR